MPKRFLNVSDCLRENELDIKRTRFAGMDGCSTMAGEHAGLKQLLAAATYHFVYIHCRNHRLALCFAHLIPKFPDFENFDSLLLNLYLLMKNSSVKQSIFEEIQQAYEIPSLKLIKAAVTRWLSHGQAGKRVLDRYETLVASWDQIYSLVKTKVIAALYFFTEVLLSTNKLRKFLQGSHLNFMEILSVVNTLIEKLKVKRENPALPQGCYYSKLEEFFDISSKSEGARFQTRSDKEFDMENFQQTTIKLFLSSLIEEIENAFDIPHHLKGFTVLDPNSIPLTVDELNEFGGDGIESLAHFYGRTSNENPAVIDPDALPPQYQAYKMFVSKKRIDYETKQKADLSKISMRLNGEKSKLATLSNILLKRKKIKIEKSIKTLENEKESLSKKQNYSFEVMLEQWMESDYAVRHSEITKLLILAALIPPSTASGTII